MIAAVNGRKSATKRAAPIKAAPKRGAANKAAANKTAPKKQDGVRKPKQVETLMAASEVPRKFTMTIQISGHEFLADPLAATRRVLVLALAQIPPKIHEEQVDNESIYKGVFNKRAETHFTGLLKDPKNPTSAPNVWLLRPADR